MALFHNMSPTMLRTLRSAESCVCVSGAYVISLNSGAPTSHCNSATQGAWTHRKLHDCFTKSHASCSLVAKAVRHSRSDTCTGARWPLHHWEMWNWPFSPPLFTHAPPGFSLSITTWNTALRKGSVRTLHHRELKRQPPPWTSSCLFCFFGVVSISSTPRVTK